MGHAKQSLSSAEMRVRTTGVASARRVLSVMAKSASSGRAWVRHATAATLATPVLSVSMAPARRRAMGTRFEIREYPGEEVRLLAWKRFALDLRVTTTCRELT